MRDERPERERGGIQGAVAVQRRIAQGRGRRRAPELGDAAQRDGAIVVEHDYERLSVTGDRGKAHGGSRRII
jgi:hypothetical protein